ncbi:hypothetical protein BK653_05905 [Pseudomonas brassicacearum]|uniref:hypothetical protein n=1 Tax=Pseudomonas brassicacearum TaxID=930166 RepID=UPI000F4777F1|nr:hypothetical protein [Pseudomonas brassicacearum]ROM71412.1 hypothetical protein BK653_05905 [Pseudomonas brassicacearum]
MELKFYHAAMGFHPVAGDVFHPVAEVTPGQENMERYELYICSVLGAIAQTPKRCDQLLAYLASVEEGSQEPTSIGGNDVLLNMDASGVQVDILVNEEWTGQPESRFTLQEWRKILEKWKYLLELPKGSDEVVIVKLP